MMSVLNIDASIDCVVGGFKGYFSALQLLWIDFDKVYSKVGFDISAVIFELHILILVWQIKGKKIEMKFPAIVVETEGTALYS